MRIVLQGGDNMLGRAVQLTLPYRTPGDSNITDTQSAQDYLNDIFENNVESIDFIREQNLDGSYLWGDLPYDLGEDLRVLNLEVAPTLSIYNEDIPEKGIHYHMNINNIPNIFSRFTRPYVLCMANNHTMDMGRTAFITETLQNITNAVGIGLNSLEAYAPRISGNIAICSFGTECSGVPSDWQATTSEAGIAYLPEITNERNVEIAFNFIYNSVKDVIDKYIIISIHWGPNWASDNDGQNYRELLAHRLIDEANVDLIHGHSSHHIRGIELYKGKLILYGAGDFINDYECLHDQGVSSKYNTTGALYIVDIYDDKQYTLKGFTVVPFITRKLRCERVTDIDKLTSLRAFVNKQSVRDSETPLLI